MMTLAHEITRDGTKQVFTSPQQQRGDGDAMAQGKMQSLECLLVEASPFFHILPLLRPLAMTRLGLKGAAQPCTVSFFLFVLSSNFLSSPFFFSLPPMVVTQIRGHIAGSSPPRAHDGSCLSFFIARRLHPFLPSSTRVELRLPTCRGAEI